MKCARCNTTLDDGVMVCSQCGAVVGMSYGRSHTPPPHVATPPPAPTTIAGKPATPSPGAPRTGARKGLTERVKGILASPRSEWGAIAAEPVNRSDVLMGYVIPLALIGPVALAIAEVGLGTALPMLGVVKASLGAGIAAAVLTFVLALVQVAVLAWAARAMARRFNAAADHLTSLQLVAYSMTPLWLAGILYLLPFLSFLWILAAIYAFVLVVVGSQVLMRCAPQQSVAYALSLVAVAVVTSLVTGGIVTALVGFGPFLFE